VFLIEKALNKNNSDSSIFFKNSSFFQNLATINYLILNKNSLSNPDQYILKGAIIQERFFKIKEKNMDEISLEKIKASILLCKYNKSYCPTYLKNKSEKKRKRSNSNRKTAKKLPKTGFA